MIVKKYIANTVEEAQSIIAEELGSKATILTLRYVKQKGWRALFAADSVEATAAIEESDLEAHTGKKMERSAAPASHANSDDLESSLAALKKVVGAVEEDGLVEAKEPTKSITPDTPPTATYGDPRFSKASAPKKVEVEAPVFSDSHEQKLSPEEEARAIRKLAALRGEVVKPARQAPSHTPSPSPHAKSPDALASTLTDFNKLGKGLLSTFGSDHEPAPAPHIPMSSTPYASTPAAPRTPIPQAPQKADVTGLSPAAAELSQLRTMIREELEGLKAPSPVATSNLSKQATKDSRFLIAKGIDTAIAEAIASDAEAATSSVAGTRSDHVNALKQAITRRVNTTGAIQLRRGMPSIVSIVGATGVGKTTTLTKIASHYALERGCRVAVISLDIIKVGAREQIRALTERLGCPLTVVTDALELRAAVATHSDYDMILIDTAGQNQYRGTEVRALARTLQSVRGITTLLAVSATTKDIDVYGTISQFECMDVDSLIVTKLDETIAHGILVNICVKTGKPLRYLTDGQRLDDDLCVADSDSIAKGILVDHNERQFDEIRRMAGV